MCCRRGGDKKVERKEDKDGEIICVFLFLLTSWISVCAFLLRLHNDCHVIVEFLCYIKSGWKWFLFGNILK
jgi:hypothetical protein